MDPIRMVGGSHSKATEDSIVNLINVGLNKGDSDIEQDDARQCYAAAQALALVYIGNALMEVSNQIDNLIGSK